MNTRPATSPAPILRWVPGATWIDCLSGVAAAGGVWIHEFGHWQVGQRRTPLAPALLCRNVNMPPQKGAAKGDGDFGWCRRAAILSAHTGMVVYAGSIDPRAGEALPPAAGARRFNIAKPGTNEAAASAGDPCLPLISGLLAATLALPGLACGLSWRINGLGIQGLVPRLFVDLSLLLLIPGVVTIGRAADALRSYEKGGRKSDGRYIREARRRRERAIARAGHG